MLVIINPMIRVVVVVEASRCVVMAAVFSGMGVPEMVGVLVDVLMEVGMFYSAVPMGVVVQVVVHMAVFVRRVRAG